MPGSVNGSPWMLTSRTRRPIRKQRNFSPTGFYPKRGSATYARGFGSVSLRTDIDEANLNPGNLPKKGVKYFDDTDWNWIVTGRQENREKVWQVLKGK